MKITVAGQRVRVVEHIDKPSSFTSGEEGIVTAVHADHADVEIAGRQTRTVGLDVGWLVAAAYVVGDWVVVLPNKYGPAPKTLGKVIGVADGYVTIDFGYVTTTRRQVDWLRPATLQDRFGNHLQVQTRPEATRVIRWSDGGVDTEAGLFVLEGDELVSVSDDSRFVAPLVKLD